MPAGGCSEPALPPSCPAAPPESGTVCPDSTLACWYDDGTRCACSSCEGGSAYPICSTIDPPEWACQSLVAGCPNPAPQAGSSCNEADQQCGDCEMPIRCSEGTWRYESNQCPICASPETPIATPQGERAIAELRAGDLVYSVDNDAIRAVPLLRASSTRVAEHHVVRVLLAGGALLEMSPGHPTADGRVFADLLRGGQLDGDHAVLAAEIVPYEYQRTYDILPASSTGTYFAAGALVGSTLARQTRVSFDVQH